MIYLGWHGPRRSSQQHSAEAESSLMLIPAVLDSVNYSNIEVQCWCFPGKNFTWLEAWEVGGLGFWACQRWWKGSVCICVFPAAQCVHTMTPLLTEQSSGEWALSFHHFLMLWLLSSHLTHLQYSITYLFSHLNNPNRVRFLLKVFFTGLKLGKAACMVRSRVNSQHYKILGKGLARIQVHDGNNI